MSATTSTARPLRETAEQQRKILLLIDAQSKWPLSWRPERAFWAPSEVGDRDHPDRVQDRR